MEPVKNISSSIQLLATIVSFALFLGCSSTEPLAVPLGVTNRGSNSELTFVRLRCIATGTAKKQVPIYQCSTNEDPPVTTVDSKISLTVLKECAQFVGRSPSASARRLFSGLAIKELARTDDLVLGSTKFSRSIALVTLDGRSEHSTNTPNKIAVVGYSTASKGCSIDVVFWADITNRGTANPADSMPIGILDESLNSILELVPPETK